MSIYTIMKNGTQMDLDHKLAVIESDLLFVNVSDLSNRREFFTRKYRGNRLNDVNVGIWDNADRSITVQIFLRNKEGFRRKQYKVTRVTGTLTNVKVI